MKAGKIHFKGLNEVRGLAAIAVFFHHLELYSFRNNEASLFDVKWARKFIENIGKDGVYLFFVLSGFLITYLLLVEKQQASKINITNFYLRRIFRIWPVYFIVLVIGFGLLPLLNSYTSLFKFEVFYKESIAQNVTWSALLFYTFFLSNFGQRVPGASQSWSVSVEEQFYFVWPNFVSIFKSKYIPYCLIFIILFAQAMRSLHVPFAGKLFEKIPIDLMAWGALLAVNLNRKFIRNFQALTRKSKLYFLLLLLLILMSLFFHTPTIFYGFFFSIFILFVISDGSNYLNSSILNRLGLISYGFYMYHPSIMIILSGILHQLGLEGIIYKMFFWLGSILISWCVSKLSYEFIEKQLIKYKDSKFKSVSSSS